MEMLKLSRFIGKIREACKTTLAVVALALLFGVAMVMVVKETEPLFEKESATSQTIVPKTFNKSAPIKVPTFECGGRSCSVQNPLRDICTERSCTVT